MKLTRAELINFISVNRSIIDCHTHSSGVELYNLIKLRYPLSQSIADLEQKELDAGVDYFITFTMPSALYGGSVGAESFPYELSNKYLMFESDLSECAIPFLSVWPGEKEEEQISFARQLQKKGKLFGFKYHCLATRQPIGSVIGTRLIDYISSVGLPIVLHTDTLSELANPNQALKLSSHHKDLRICVAHAGYFDAKFMDCLNDYPNVYFDVSPLSRLCYKARYDLIQGRSTIFSYKSPLKLLQSLLKAFPNKLLWGTDEPWTSLVEKGEYSFKSSIKEEMALLHGLSQTAIQKIAHDNVLDFLAGKAR